MRISIIVPTLNEERALDRTLEHLTSLGEEVVVSDGGSDDRTREIAQKHTVVWTEGAPGRGGQLNRGAAVANGDGLLFVHADTQLPTGALSMVSEVLEQGYGGGGFAVRFEGSRRLMAVGAHLVNLRTRLTRAPLGDQAQFAHRDVFEQLGGFRDWPILEDLDFIRRLRKQSRIGLIPTPVTTSDRRYAQRGIARTVATNWMIWGLHAAGVSPERLARLYRQVR
jgi:rSAM/selenodomain-associated transferase 2